MDQVSTDQAYACLDQLDLASMGLVSTDQACACQDHLDLVSMDQACSCLGKVCLDQVYAFLAIASASP